MLERVKHLLGLSEEKLKAAEYLYRGGFYEDSVSRAYYSMYHAARAILLLKDIEPKTHRGVLSMFGLHLVGKEDVDAYMGKALSFAQEIREKSDYDEKVHITKNLAENILQDARLFLHKTKEVVKKLSKD